jgi:hypothetical protein
MPKKWKILIFSLLALAVLGSGNVYANGAAPSSGLKVGDEAHWFTLPSTEDRTVDYYKDYYGKHHLILTFFPAAFTPT